MLTIWVIHIIDWVLPTSFNWLGTHPFHFKEWYTFITGALIHGDWSHLVNNTYPLLVLGMFLIFLYGKYSNFVFVTSYFFTGLFIFLFARQNTYHIGASGVVYCWAALLATSGFVRKDRISLGLGLLVAFLYGSMIWGIFPIQEGVSWDGHLIGALTGVVFAFLYRNINVTEKINEEEEIIKEPYRSRQFENSPYRYIQKQIEKEEQENTID